MDMVSVWTDLFLLVGWVLSVVACWRIFSDHGEKGWKALIPVYSTYILFKLFYQTKQFWYFVVAMVGFIASNICFSMGMVMGALLGDIPAYAWIGALLMIVTLVWGVVIEWRLFRSLASAYGKGTGFTVGLLFLTGIFECILAFSKKDDVAHATIHEDAHAVDLDATVSETVDSSDALQEKDVVDPVTNAEEEAKPEIPTEDAVIEAEVVSEETEE